MDLTVTDSRLVAVSSGMKLWVSVVILADGMRIQHVMPEDTLEIRAAEYGFDPDDDRDELLEIVIREPLTPDPPGLRDDPRHLWNTTDLPTARELLRERFIGVGRLDSRNRRPTEQRPPLPPGAAVLLDNDDHPDTPLGMLRREMPADRDRMAVIREVVDDTRRKIRTERARTAVVVAQQSRVRPSAAELRAALRPGRVLPSSPLSPPGVPK